MTYQEFITSNVFWLVSCGALCFVAWVVQMLLEIDERKAGVVCLALGVLWSGGYFAARHQHLEAKSIAIEAAKAAERERFRLQEEARKRAEQERVEAAKKLQEERQAAIREKENLERLYKDARLGKAKLIMEWNCKYSDDGIEEYITDEGERFTCECRRREIYNCK